MLYKCFVFAREEQAEGQGAKLQSQRPRLARTEKKQLIWKNDGHKRQYHSIWGKQQ